MLLKEECKEVKIRVRLEGRQTGFYFFYISGFIVQEQIICDLKKKVWKQRALETIFYRAMHLKEIKRY